MLKLYFSDIMYALINVPAFLTLALRVAVGRLVIFIILAFLISLGYGNAQKKQNDLKGNVKQIGEFHFEIECRNTIPRYITERKIAYY